MVISSRRLADRSHAAGFAGEGARSSSRDAAEGIPPKAAEIATIRANTRNLGAVGVGLGLIVLLASGSMVIETYAPNADGRFRGTDLALSQRVHRTTATGADGGSSVIEELEGRSLASPGEPLRVVRRTEATTRSVGTNSLVTDRRVFERDANGRLQLVATETEQHPKN